MAGTAMAEHARKQAAIVLKKNNLNKYDGCRYMINPGFLVFQMMHLHSGNVFSLQGNLALVGKEDQLVGSGQFGQHL